MRECIPDQAAEPVMDPRRIQKSVPYGSSTVFLQSRRKGIRTNDLMIRSEDGALRYLCRNQHFIADFCISSRGILYFSEAGRDHGHAVGTRGHDFRLGQIDLKTVPGRIEPLLHDRTFSEPRGLELSRNQELLCFADHFGKLHVVELAGRREIDIGLDGIDPDRVHGLCLSTDKESFLVLVNTGQYESGAFVWKKGRFPLPAP